MSKKILNFLKYLLFLAAGLLLLWLAARGQDFQRIREAFLHANYWWVGLSALLSVLSHIFRALRWKLLIEPIGFKPRFANTFFAVMTGYFANLALPRLGEVTKCGVLNKYEKIPVDKLLGTMIVERAFDFLTMLLLLVLVLLFQFHLFSDFLNKYVWAPMGEKLGQTGHLGWIVLLCFGLVLGLLFWFRKPLSRNVVFQKGWQFAKGIWHGIASVRDLQRTGLFAFYTLAIWGLYLSMAWVVFYAFPETSHLGFWPAMSILVFGSIGMVAPVQGGIGAFHFMASRTLVVYGIAAEPALAYAFLNHGASTLTLIVLGFVSLILLPLTNRERQDRHT